MTFQHRTPKIAAIWIVLLLLWIILVPRSGMELEHVLAKPSLPELPLGRDVFGRNLMGALGEAMGRSLLFSLGVTFAALIIGVSAGATLGMLKNRSRYWLERILDFFLAFPPMLLALTVQAAIGTGWRSLAFSVSFGLFPGIVRFTAVRAKEIGVTDYLEAARAIGGGAFGNFWRHYRPALLDHLRLKFPSILAQALLLEATLSFLNLGVPPGTVSWGALLAQAKDYLVEAPHIAWSVGIPLVLTLLALQYVVDEMSQKKLTLR